MTLRLPLRKLKTKSIAGTLTALFIVPVNVQAQNFIDLLTVAGESTQTHFEESRESTTIQDLSLSLTLPIPITEDVAFLTGYSGTTLQSEFDPGAGNTTVANHIVKLGLNLKHTDHLSGTYMFLPRYSANWGGGLSSQNIMYGGLALIKIKKSETLNYQFGVYHNGDLFGPFFVPLLGFYHTYHKWTFNALLPIRADVNYALKSGVSAGLNFTATVQSFYLNRENDADRYLHQQSNEVMLYMAYQHKSGLQFELGAGVSIGRSYREYTAGDETDFTISAFKFGDDRNQLNQDTADSIFLRFTTRYRHFLD